MTSKIAELAAERQISQKELVRKVIEQSETMNEAATALGVYPTSLVYWLSTNGITVSRRLVWNEAGQK